MPSSPVVSSFAASQDEQISQVTADNASGQAAVLLGYTEHSDTVIAIQRTTCRILHFSRPDLVIDLVHNLVAKSLATDSIEDLRDAAWHLMEAKLDPASVEVEVDVYWDNLATAFRYHFIALENTSALADCIRCTEQALWLRPLGHPQRNESLHNLAALLDDTLDMKRDATEVPDEVLNTDNDVKTLKRIIELHEEALTLRGEGHRARPDTIHCLAFSFARMHYLTQNMTDLGQSIKYFRTLVETIPHDQTGRVSAMSNLATKLTSYGRLTGSLNQIDEGIRLFEEVLELRPADHPAHMASVSNLALAYFRLYGITGGRNALQSAIYHYKNAHDSYPQEHPQKPYALTNLAVALARLSIDTGDPIPLEDSIRYHAEALTLAPSGHPNHGSMVLHMGRVLRILYERTGDFSALQEVIRLYKNILPLVGSEHPNRVRLLTVLAAALRDKFEATRDEVSMNEAMRHAQEVLKIRPKGAPQRDESLSNLADYLTVVFQCTGDHQSLDEAIHFLEEAVELNPRGHSNRAGMLHNLAYAYNLRFESKRDLVALENSIRLSKEALELRISGHPDRAFSHMQLAWQHLQDSPYRDYCETFEHALEAVSDPYGNPRDLLRVLASFVLDLETRPGHVLQGHEEERLLAVYKRLIQLLPRVASLGLGLSRRLQELQRGEKLGATAARRALMLPDPQAALELLEESRAVFWSQALRLRRSPLDDLPNEEAERLRNLFHALQEGDRARTHDLDPDEHFIPSWNDESLNMRRRQGDEVEVVLAGIRQRPGFERFLLGKSYLEMACAARKSSVVVLVAHQDTCSAIVLPQGLAPVPIHVPLPNLNLHDLWILGHYVGDPNMRLAASDVNGDAYRGLKKAKAGQPVPQVTVPAGQGGGDGQSMVKFDAANMEAERLLGELWRQVVKPIIEVLNLQRLGSGQDRPRIHWCPTGAFSFLPLHAAGQCMDYVVSSYTPTLTALLHAQDASKSLPIADMKALLVAEPRAPGLRRLYHVADEVATISDSLAAVLPVLSIGDIGVNWGPGATISAVKAGLADASIVHLACHGTQDADPLQSGFCLRDARLTVDALMAMDLAHAQFAFLSACETARGDLKQPDQVIHLAAAMLFVGFRSVVATMWPMHDEDGPFVAKTVYSELAKLTTFTTDAIPHALDLAVRKLRALRAPPHRWAPFVHMGA